MTVSTDVSRVSYNGNGVTVLFSVPFPFIQEDYLTLVILNTSTLVETTLILNSAGALGYTVSGSGEAVGSVTLVTAPTGSEILTIFRSVPATQESDFVANDPFPAEVFEDALDKLTMIVGQTVNDVDRALKLFDGDVDGSGRYNANGNRIVGAADGVAASDVATVGQLISVGSGNFIADGSGAEIRTVQSKLRDIVSAGDFGVAGDGSDETTKIQNMLNAAQGKVLMLGYGKTYAFATATGLTFPANTTLIANGSKFKRLTAQVGAVTDANYNITVGNDCTIDRLELDCIGGAADIGGLIITGSRVRIGTIKVNALAAGSGSLGNSWNAVRVGPNSGTANDVHVGEIVATDWDRPVALQNLDGWSVGFIRVVTYRRGVYIKDCANGVVRGGKITGLSANSTGAAGDNGVLIEAATSDRSTHDIRIENVTVEDAGEHSFRIGGAFISNNIWHVNCHSKASGSANSGVYPPANNGGCGFKCLGPTASFGKRHQNIHYISCSVEDINATSIANLIARAGKTNFAGFQLGKVMYGSIVNPVVMKRPASDGSYSESGNSCFNGIEIIGCQKVTITNPQIQRPAGSGIYIYDFSDGVNDWGQTDDIDIIGGHINTPTSAGLEVDCSVITMRRISVKGLQVNSGAYTMLVNKSGTGAFVSCHSEMRSLGATTESFNGLGTDWTITAQGTEVGSNACANGSTYQSFTAGTLRVRKAGAWVSL